MNDLNVSHRVWKCSLLSFFLRLICCSVLLSLLSTVALAEKTSKKYLAEGAEYIANGEEDKGIAEFRKALTVLKSDRYLIKIAEAMEKYGRVAEAIDIYQKYLEKHSRGRKHSSVKKTVKRLKAKSGRVEVYVDPKNSEIKVNGRVVRLGSAYPFELFLDPGDNMLTFSCEGHRTKIHNVSVVEGDNTKIEISLFELEFSSATIPVKKVPSIIVKTEKKPAFEPTPRVRLPWEYPSREEGIGAYVGAHIDVRNKGAAGIVGLSYGMFGWLDILIGGVISKEKGAYLGGRIFLMDGELSPIINLGGMAFFVDDMELGGRAGAGFVWAPFSKLWFVGDFAAEYYPKKTGNYQRFLLVPSFSVEGRL